MRTVPFIRRLTRRRGAGTLGAVAFASLVAACGGGGDGGSAAPAGVAVGGVAATGLALANATVDVKCASGTGTATTRADGAYDVTVSGGVLPCIVRVTGVADGTEVTLHSLASGSGTTATANVTPLTELVLARAAGAVGASLFESFSAATAPTPTALATAKTELLTQLSAIVGRDLTTIADPFTTPLVADVAGDTGRGNAYDDALEALKASVPVAALAGLAGQLASTVGTGAPVTLTEVITNVSRGTLANCPAALSGKYRLVEYTGAIDEVEFRFGTTNTLGDGTPIVPSSSQPCEFTVDATTVYMGQSGVGAFRDAERVGYVVPVQSHRLADVLGDWDFTESGIEESNLGIHFLGRISFDAAGAGSVCEFDVMGNNFASCVPDAEDRPSISQGSDGGFVLAYGSDRSPVYGFRAANGALTLFGSNNPNGVSDPGAFRTHFVLTRPLTVRPQAVGTVSRYWDVRQNYDQAGVTPTTNGTLTTAGTPGSLTNTAASDTSVTRQLATGSDTLLLNQPVAGLRYRAPASGVTSVFQRPIPGLDLTVTLDNTAGHFYAISLGRPAATP